MREEKFKLLKMETMLKQILKSKMENILKMYNILLIFILQK